MLEPRPMIAQNPIIPTLDSVSYYCLSLAITALANYLI